MPHLDIKTEYNLILTPQEFRLVLLGLRGDLVDKKDVEAAVALAEDLHQRRIHDYERRLDTMKQPKTSKGRKSDA